MTDEPKAAEPVKLRLVLADVVAAAQESTEALQREEAESLGLTLEQLWAKWETDQRIARRAELLERSGILVTREDVELISRESYQRTVACEHVRSWLARQDPRPVLVMCGTVGRGKTFAAATAIASLGHGVAIKSPELAARVNPCPSDLANDVRRVDLSRPFIVLDDLGTEASSPRWAEAFFRFVECRSLRGRTIVTSNLLRRQFRERYDPRVIDRLNAVARAVELTGPSMRDQGGGL